MKQLVGLMFDIRDMSEKDKVFCFVEGLKPWAKTKLYEQRVQDLMSAYAATERLFDLTSDSQDVRCHQIFSPRMNKNSRSSSSKDAGEENILVETVDPTNRIQRTHGKGRTIETHPRALLVASYVGGHIWQENTRIKLASMRFRPL